MRRKYICKIRPIISVIGPSICYVQLTQGKFSLIDSQDSEAVGQYNWHAHKNNKSHGFYAYRHYPLPDGTYKILGMHTELVGTREGQHADHKNGNGLDNRLSWNLRKASPTENGSNRPMSKGNTSGFKGVSKEKNRWRAVIRANGKNYRLGTFTTPEAAAMAYRVAAASLHGEFMRNDL